MAECTELVEWAYSLPPARYEPISGKSLTRNLQLMQATLPARSVDESAGEMRTAVYVGILGRHTLEEIKYLTDRACRELRWFPTPSECLAIIADYRAPPTEQSGVLAVCSRFAAQALDDWIANVADGQPLGDAPDHWLRIAVERCVVRRLEDGSYVSRALFVGPTMAGKYGDTQNKGHAG